VLILSNSSFSSNKEWFHLFQPDKGTLFEIPVTVVKPEVLSACDKKQSVSYKEVSDS